MVLAHEFFDVAIVGTVDPPATPVAGEYYISGDGVSTPGGVWAGFIPPFLASIPNGVDWNTKPLNTRTVYYDTVERQSLMWDGTSLRSPVGGLATAVPGGTDEDSNDYPLDATFQSIGLTVTGIETLGGSIEVQAIASSNSLATLELQVTLNGAPFIGPISSDLFGYFPVEYQINFNETITAADTIDVSVRELGAPAANPFIRGSKLTSILTVYESRFAPLSIHAGDHTSRGLDPLVGDVVDIAYSPPGGYIPTVRTGVTATTDDLSSHLNGIALALQNTIIQDCTLISVGTTTLDVGVDVDSETLTLTQDFVGTIQAVYSGFIKSTHVRGTTVTFNLFINGADANVTSVISFSITGSDFASTHVDIFALDAGDTIFIRMTASGRDGTLDNVAITDVAAGTQLCLFGTVSGGVSPITDAWTTITAELGADLQASGADTLGLVGGYGISTRTLTFGRLSTFAKDTVMLGAVTYTQSGSINVGENDRYLVADLTAGGVLNVNLPNVLSTDTGVTFFIKMIGVSQANTLTINTGGSAEFIGQSVYYSSGDILIKLDNTPPGLAVWRVSLLDFQRTRSDGPKWRNGIMYFSSMFSGRQLTTVSKVAGQIQYMPFNVPNTVTISQLKIEVTAAIGGSSTWIGIYEDSLVTVGEPGERVFSSSVTTETVGVRTLSTITPFVLDPGTYWTAISASDQNLAFRSVATAAISMAYGAGPNATPLGTTRTARIENTTPNSALPQTAAPTAHNTLDQPIVGIVTQ